MTPDIIIAGVPKAGTSSVFSWLAAHPDVTGASEKETYFLIDPGTHMHRPDAHVSNGLDGWGRWFPAPKPGSLLLEATPGYIYSRTAREVLAGLPTRLVFILREPAAMIHSGYVYWSNNWNWIPAEMDFTAYLEAARAGHPFNGNELATEALTNARHVDHLAAWEAAVGRDRMLVYLFDDLKADGAAFMRRLASDLGIDPSFYDGFDFPRENETYAVKNRSLQRLNLALRSRLPKGALYRGARALYRRLNTGKPETPDADADARRALAAEYREANGRLAEAWNLDLTRWTACAA